MGNSYIGTHYGDVNIYTSYTIDEIKQIILSKLAQQPIIYPESIFRMIIDSALAENKVIGCEDNIYYPSLYANDIEKEKINKALAELLISRKIYFNFYTKGFNIW